MLDKILLATDLSPAWDDILACGAELKALGCSHVILTHVITVEAFVGLDAALRAEAQPRLEEQKQLLAASGLDVIMEMPLGLPAFSLNDVADRHCASLIVVGSHGKSLWRENVLGSIASAVLHNTRYPVLLLKVYLKKAEARPTCQVPGTELVRHVLVLTDFSPVADRAFEFFAGLAPRGVQEVTLLHAGATSPEPGEMSPQARLEAMQARLSKGGPVRVHLQVTPGHPLTIIEGTWMTGNFSLIVLGTHGKGFVKEMFLGSVANNVARLAPCPVLLVPAAPK